MSPSNANASAEGANPRNPTADEQPQVPPGPPTPERLRGWIERLEAGMLERDGAVRLALLAALAGEHVLLIGPPGTAKSELARRLRQAFAGAPYFERLLTRFSTPEELFGPLSLKALEDDRYERLTEGYLPTAGIAFLDEVFKANSAILNALLTLLNEREFDNGAGRQRTPLVAVIAASNEVPADEALQAFFDRFLLRVVVQPVSDAAFATLLGLPAAPTAAPDLEPLGAAECAALRAAAGGVRLSDAALGALLSLRPWLAENGMVVSDRRWRRLVGLLQVQAAAQGRAEVDGWDLWLLPQVLAADAAGAQRLADWLAREIWQVHPEDLSWLTRAVEGFEQQLALEERAEADGDDGGAGKLALARAVGGAGRSRADDNGEGAMTRLMSAALEDRQRRRWSSVHITARRRQVDEVLASAQPRADQAQQRCAELAAALHGRLWWPPSQMALLKAVLEGNRDRLQALIQRAEATHAGFSTLPVEPEPAALPENAGDAAMQPMPGQNPVAAAA